MSRTRYLLALPTVAAALVSLAACNSVQGSPTPTYGGSSSSSGSTGQSSSAPSGGAPTVSNPLNTDKYLTSAQAICNVLTAGQVQQLGITAQPEPKTDPAGDPSCQWIDNSTFLNVSVALPSKKTGLGNLYSLNKQSGYFAYFEPTTADGYPAVFASVADLRSTGQCTLDVGLADDTMSVMNVGHAKTAGNCERTAKKLAASVIQTIKGGG